MVSRNSDHPLFRQLRAQEQRYRNTYQPPSTSQIDLWHRNITVDVFFAVAIVIVSAAYILHHQHFRVGNYHFTLQRLAWDLAILLTPGLLLQIVDRLLDPKQNTTPMTLTLPHAAKSETVARIFGLDGTQAGIMASVHQARRRLSSVSSPFGKDRTPAKPPGLGNWDNSCYQNSVLQGLSSLFPLPRYLAGPDGADRMGELSTAFNLLGLIADLNSGDNNGRTLWTPGVLKSMSSRIQQDAQEYFSKVLDEVDKEITKAVRAKLQRTDPGFARRDTDDGDMNSDAISRARVVDSKDIQTTALNLRNPLEGLVAQRVACVRCGYSEGLSMTPFNCLTLNLGTSPLECDIFQRLDAFTGIERIEGVHCAKCTLLKNRQLLLAVIAQFQARGAPEEVIRANTDRLAAVEAALEDDDFEDKTLKEKCQIPASHKVSSTKTKQMVIARPPQSLVLHINRSVFDEQTFQLMKNPAPVRFPVDLDLGPWCLGSATDPTAKIDGDEEHWVTQANASMAAGERGQCKVSGPMYQLRAVVIHQGRHDNGHYVCYRKHSGLNKIDSHEAARLAGLDPGNAAIEMDDLKSNIYSQEDWWRLSDDTVYKCTEDEVLAQPGAFMLFYDCVDDVPVRSVDLEATADVVPQGDESKQASEPKQSQGSESSGNRGSETSQEDSQRSSDVTSSPEPPESVLSV